MRTNARSKRVLLLTPTGRDAALISRTLSHTGIEAKVCANMQAVTAELQSGADVAIVAEEAFTREAIETLNHALRAQPLWSDLPLVVLSTGQESSAVKHSWLGHLSPLANVTVVERPVRPATLLSVVETALRARHRQYEVERLLGNLQITEERLRTIIDSAQDYAIINLDLNGRVTYWNSGATRLLGYTEEAILGRSFEAIFLEPDRAAGEPARMIETALRTGRAQSEGWRVRADGSRFWASGILSQTRDTAGCVTGFVDVLRDITERKESEERLAEQAKALQRSNDDLQRFAYVASHDLQEPLRIVASYSELLVRQCGDHLDENSRKFVGFIVDGVERMRALIRDLLDFSRLNNEQARPPEPVDCNAFLRLAIEHLTLKIRETHAEITSDRLPCVLAHDTRVLQVFQNLIGNALKYCRTSPRVHVSASRQDECWCIAVRDNGIGIAPEYHDKIFGLFQRLHSQADYPGTGIGLATCKRIVEQQGGRIWVESADGQGSTFYFTLPAVNEDTSLSPSPETNIGSSIS